MRTASFAPLDPLCEQPSLIRQSAFGNRNSVLGPAKIFLRLQCRSTTHSRSGNGLFVKAIGHVAGDENAVMFAPDQVFWKYVPLGVHLQFASIGFGVGIMSNRDENAGDFPVA